MNSRTTKLIFVDDSLPGITRKGAGKGWAYYDADGGLIRDTAERERLNAIALPPAYEDCWFCPAPNGHILATGYDAKRRKQYRYHPDFRALRDSEKFDRCLAFGNRLPLLRKRVADDLAARDLGLQRALAGTVRLLDLGAIRIGNDTYARDNGSYGATTIKSHHVTVRGKTLRFRFKAKSGKHRDLRLTDTHLARIVRQMQDLDGQDLFSFVDEGDQAVRDITSTHVNAYLRDTMGADFTAKNFRTWHASAMAFGLLAGAKQDLTIKYLTESVAEHLGNTPAITRKSYIHPAVFDLMDRQGEWREGLALPRRTKWLSREERGLISFLEDAPSISGLLAA
ncbi:DNA topoisomerase IB [Alteriqipengyuania lutimaris]|uniref:DNA topoisomerase n=1 Tax=Alteriqipengyuania lutimaris TaxID=1538146 RepID=A0A395LHJ9_9SPHN|nr:DNA topoisomerase IB [Alteriqipengyuania lutimaris]RDS76135.1 DNA topoisomerase IB [Alteriqipengyuania lutimaris]